MKNIKKKFLVFFIILLLIVILGILTINNRNLINNIFKTQIEKETTDSLFSYVVYDNKDSQNIKVLMTINSENGIEYIEYPNGNKVNGNGKNKLIIDYIAANDSSYTFTIKEINKEKLEKNIIINNDSIQETSLNIETITDVSGYKAINIDKKINLENYGDVYYKISENGTWMQGTKLSMMDYDLTKNGLVDGDNTVTVFAKTTNSITNDEIIVNQKYNVDTTEETGNIQADSLLQAMNDNNLKNGKYEVTVSDETYNVKVYDIKENLEISIDTEIGTEEDVATASEYAQNMVVLKVNGDLTIGKDAKLTSYASKNGYGGPKGMMIYCTGTLTNNGEISMTARGAKAEGQNVYLWQNADSSYEYVPAVGAAGAVRKNGGNWKPVKGNVAENGINRQTRRRRKWSNKILRNFWKRRKWN